MFNLFVKEKTSTYSRQERKQLSHKPIAKLPLEILELSCLDSITGGNLDRDFNDFVFNVNKKDDKLIIDSSQEQNK